MVSNRRALAATATSVVVAAFITGCAESGVSEEAEPTTTGQESTVAETTDTSAQEVDAAIKDVDFANHEHVAYTYHNEGIAEVQISLSDGQGEAEASEPSSAGKLTINSVEVAGYADLDADGDLDAMVELNGERSYSEVQNQDPAPVRQYTVWLWDAESKEPVQATEQAWMAGDSVSFPSHSLGGVCRVTLDETEDGQGGKLTLNPDPAGNPNPRVFSDLACEDGEGNDQDPVDITIVADQDTHEVTRAPSEGGGLAGLSFATFFGEDEKLEGEEAEALRDQLATRLKIGEGKPSLETPIDTDGKPITAVRAYALGDKATEGHGPARLSYTTDERGQDAPVEAWSSAYYVPNEG